MNLVGIAAKAGTTTTCLEDLINKGEGSIRIARKIGTSSENIMKFIEGTVSQGIAKAIGTNMKNAQDLRDKIGREGAIGLIIGFACGFGSSKG